MQPIEGNLYFLRLFNSSEGRLKYTDEKEGLRPAINDHVSNPNGVLHLLLRFKSRCA